MALISIGGVNLPTPSDYQVDILDLSKAERNARGTMIIERIATKRKLEIRWNYLDKTQLKQILNLVSPVFFAVTYLDPQTDGNKSGTFYSGDRPIPMLDFQKSVPRYRDVKLSLIER